MVSRRFADSPCSSKTFRTRWRISRGYLESSERLNYWSQVRYQIRDIATTMFDADVGDFEVGTNIAHVNRRDRYLVALRDFITGFSIRDPCYKPAFKASSELVITPFNHEERENGKCWPLLAYSMTGRRRLDNVRDLITTAIYGNIPGGFLEAGVWRGGASIMAAGTIAAFGEEAKRKVYVCDSFQGLPRSSNGMDYDGWEVSDVLAVSLDQVRQHFKNSNLLRSNVEFVKGFFNESLPSLGDRDFKLAVLRADGDMYESTMDILFNLYDKISLGGFLIIDDWEVDVCRKAVKHFFYIHGFRSIRIEVIDESGAFIVKEHHFDINHRWYRNFNKQRSVTAEYWSKKTTNKEKTGKCKTWPHRCIDEFYFQYADKLM